MNLKKIIIFALAILILVFALSKIEFPNFLAGLFGGKSFSLKPTMLQVTSIKDIVKLNSAFYVGEILISYKAEENATNLINRNTDVAQIKEILSGNGRINYLNDKGINFSAALRIEDPEKLNLEKWREIYFDSINENYVNRKRVFDYINMRANHFKITFFELFPDKEISYSENIEYNLERLNLKYIENKKKKTIKLKDPDVQFDLINWDNFTEKILEELIRNKEPEYNPLIVFLKANNNKHDFLKLIEKVNDNTKRAYFIHLMKNKPQRDIDKKFVLYNLISFCKFKTIDESKFNEIIKNESGNPENFDFSKLDIFTDFDWSDDVVLLVRGKVFASYDLKDIECIYAKKPGENENEPNSPGILFIATKSEKQQPELEAVVNPFLVLDKENQINGFELILAQDPNKYKLDEKNQILSQLKKKAKDKLIEDAIVNGIRENAKTSAESSLMRIFTMIKFKNPGEIIAVNIIGDQDEIDQKYKKLLKFNGEDWEELKSNKKT